MKLMKFFLLNKKKVKNDLAYFKQDLLLKIGKEQFNYRRGRNKLRGFNPLDNNAAGRR